MKQPVCCIIRTSQEVFPTLSQCSTALLFYLENQLKLALKSTKPKLSSAES